MLDPSDEEADFEIHIAVRLLGTDGDVAVPVIASNSKRKCVCVRIEFIGHGVLTVFDSVLMMGE